MLLSVIFLYFLSRSWEDQKAKTKETEVMGKEEEIMQEGEERRGGGEGVGGGVRRRSEKSQKPIVHCRILPPDINLQVRCFNMHLSY